MPYMREGATKIGDHWVRRPLLKYTNGVIIVNRLRIGSTIRYDASNINQLPVQTIICYG